MNLTVIARIGGDGHEVYAFQLDADGVSPEDVTLTGNILDTYRDKRLAEIDGRDKNGILSVTSAEGTTRIEVLPFSINCPFVLTVKGVEFTKDTAEKIATDWADKFEPFEKGKVKYRLYSPEQNGKRPLVLFLHGGGEQGCDNVRQIYDCMGAAKVAEQFPESYVMAPQAPGQPPKHTDVVQNIGKSGFWDAKTSGAWTREYVAAVCDVIRDMIADGRVDPERVYVTGLSMGGAGTLMAMNVGSNLFAAALCICPTMTPETYRILCGLTHAKIWITCSYMDHIVYRHKYIVDGVMKLKDMGNKDVHLTIFAPEELEAYGISVLPELSLRDKADWNHWCWVPTYNNEHGALSWLMNQHK